MSTDMRRAERTDYSLVDAGEGRRLERFGPVLLDRLAPTATEWRRDPAAWRGNGFRFDSDGDWAPMAVSAPLDSSLTSFGVEPWPVLIDGLRMEVRLTASGGVGLYPEHRANMAWLERQVRSRVEAGTEPSVLNLFAHTGLLTLAAARAGASVTHVDGARSTSSWARHNAALSGLAERPVRWIVDDAAAFVAREARRARRYDGIVLDPPSLGHARGRRWRLVDELPALLRACAAVAVDAPFVLLTAHTTGLEGADLESMLRAAFPAHRARIERSPLDQVAESRARLDLGWSVRLSG